MIDYNRMIKADWTVIEKSNLTGLEVKGLEKALIELVKGFEEENYGEFYNEDIADLAFITDGVLNLAYPYIINGKKIECLCCTESHVILAYVIDEETKEEYYMRLD